MKTNLAAILTIIGLLALLAPAAHAILPGGRPADIDTGPLGGVLRIDAVYGSAILTHDLYYSLDRGASWSFVCELSQPPHVCTTNLLVPPHTEISLQIKIWSSPQRRHFVRNINYIYGSTNDNRDPQPGDLDPDGDPAARIGDHYEIGPHSYCGLGPLDVTALHARPGTQLGLFCIEDLVDFDRDDAGIRVGFVPGSEITPTPAPALSLSLRNPEGQPVVLPMGRSRFALDWWAGALISVTTELWGWHSDFTGPVLPPAPDANCRGGYVRTNYADPHLVLGVTAVPPCNVRDYETAASSAVRYHCGWCDDWPEGERQAVIILATPTPMGTPTPTLTSAPTRTPAATKTRTPAPTSTTAPTPTSTPAPTATPAQTPTPTHAPVQITLERRHPHRIWFGTHPPFNQEAQMLEGSITAGAGSFLGIYVFPPQLDGTPCDFAHAACPFSLHTVAVAPDQAFTLDAARAGDPDFGTWAQGIWQAYAVIAGSTSNTVSWTVSWNHSHVTR